MLTDTSFQEVLMSKNQRSEQDVPDPISPWDPIGEIEALLARGKAITEKEVQSALASVRSVLLETAVWSDRDGLVKIWSRIAAMLHPEPITYDRRYLVHCAMAMADIAADLTQRLRPKEQDDWARNDPAIMEILVLLSADLPISTATLKRRLRRGAKELGGQLDRLAENGLIDSYCTLRNTRYATLSPPGQDLLEQARLRRR